MRVIGRLVARVRCALEAGSRMLLLLLIGLLSVPIQAEALGFGALSLSSHLNQTLAADIPLLLHDTDDMKIVRIELAKPAEYKKLGLQWQPALAHVRVLIKDKFSGQPMIQLRSTGLIHSPMLSVVLKASTSGHGTYFKHYKLFLDPAEASATVWHQKPALTLKLNSSEQGMDKPLHQGDVWARTWRYGPVRAGDNLSEIAYRLRMDKRFSNKQVMLSLYEKNAGAFVDGNINHLKKGVWLTVPRASVVEGFAGKTSVRKLYKLLQRDIPVARGGAKSKATTDGSVTASTDARSLRYSGKISMGGANAIIALETVTAMRQDFDQQFGSIHQDMMAGKLQMTSLDESVSGLNQSVQEMKSELQLLQENVEIIMMRTEVLSQQEYSKLWPFVLIAVLLVLLVIAAVMLRKRKADDELGEEEEFSLLADHQAHEAGMMESQFDSMPDHLSEVEGNADVIDPKANPMADHLSEKAIDYLDEDPNHLSKLSIDLPDTLPSHLSEEDPASMFNAMSDQLNEAPASALNSNQDEGFTPQSDALIQLLNQMEERLSQCDYEQAEKTLAQIEVKWADSLKAMALKAQLYHETDRHEARNDLINRISESSDEQRWERFCYFLPLHVWNACFGDTPSPAEPQF